jgi:small conductance mechanosensitive channel
MPEPTKTPATRRHQVARTRSSRATAASRTTHARTSARTRALARQPPGAVGRGRRVDARAYRQGAQRQLQRFRKGSVLAVALTALLLMLWGDPLAVAGQVVDGAGHEETAAAAAADRSESVPDPSEAMSEATSTIRELALSFYAFLPRLALVLLLLAAATLVSRIVQWSLRRTLGAWERVEAASAITRLVVFLVAAVASMSVLAGDVRAVVGSVGLLGLAASWALQTPIESFTGWLLNSFRGYYKVGDRIAVGDVFGDVYRIDILTTTVWEAGGQGKPVSAAQATGALITFPNWEVLRSNIVNYSRDFPFVWDEITINVANESDLAYTSRVLQEVARRVLGPEMADAAQRYENLLRAQRLTFDVDEVPRVYLSSADSWTDCTIRYLVPVRSRRTWSSRLVLAASEEMASAEHAGRILPVYPRTEVLLRDGWAHEGDPPAPR